MERQCLEPDSAGPGWPQDGRRSPMSAILSVGDACEWQLSDLHAHGSQRPSMRMKRPMSIKISMSKVKTWCKELLARPAVRPMARAFPEEEQQKGPGCTHSPCSHLAAPGSSTAEGQLPEPCHRQQHVLGQKAGIPGRTAAGGAQGLGKLKKRLQGWLRRAHKEGVSAAEASHVTPCSSCAAAASGTAVAVVSLPGTGETPVERTTTRASSSELPAPQHSLSSPRHGALASGRMAPCSPSYTQQQQQQWERNASSSSQHLDARVVRERSRPMLALSPSYQSLACLTSGSFSAAADGENTLDRGSYSRSGTLSPTWGAGPTPHRTCSMSALHHQQPVQPWLHFHEQQLLQHEHQQHAHGALQAQAIPRTVSLPVLGMSGAMPGPGRVAGTEAGGKALRTQPSLSASFSSTRFTTSCSQAPTSDQLQLQRHQEQQLQLQQRQQQWTHVQSEMRDTQALPPPISPAAHKVPFTRRSFHETPHPRSGSHTHASAGGAQGGCSISPASHNPPFPRRSFHEASHPHSGSNALLSVGGFGSCTGTGLVRTSSNAASMSFAGALRTASSSSLSSSALPKGIRTTALLKALSRRNSTTSMPGDPAAGQVVGSGAWAGAGGVVGAGPLGGASSTAASNYLPSRRFSIDIPAILANTSASGAASSAAAGHGYAQGRPSPRLRSAAAQPSPGHAVHVGAAHCKTLDALTLRAAAAAGTYGAAAPPPARGPVHHHHPASTVPGAVAAQGLHWDLLSPPVPGALAAARSHLQAAGSGGALPLSRKLSELTAAIVGLEEQEEEEEEGNSWQLGTASELEDKCLLFATCASLVSGNNFSGVVMHEGGGTLPQAPALGAGAATAPGQLAGPGVVREEEEDGGFF